MQRAFLLCLLLAGLSLAILPACSESDGDGDADGDADGDSDGDADGDSDGDADGDSDGDADGDSDGDADGDLCEDVDCDDGVDCTTDACDPATGECSNTPDDTFCDDGDPCTGTETCDATDGCLSGEVPDECLLTCTSLTPTSGSVGLEQSLTLSGTDIAEDVTVALEADDGTLYDLGTPVVEDGTSATITIPAGTIPEGTYTVLIRNALVDVSCGSYEGIAALSCGEVQPSTLSVTVDSELQLPGVRIETGAAVVLTDVDTGDTYDVGTATVDDTTGVAVVPITAGTLPPGLYTVTVTNSEGETTECLTSIRVSSLPPPTVTDVTPRAVWEGDPADDILSDARVSVLGEGFLITPSVTWVSSSDPSQRFEALEVIWVSASELTAVCPAETLGMPAGEYHVIVTNPDGLSGVWIDEETGIEGLFEVTTDPPPRIDTIDPVRSPASADATIDINGEFFVDGAVATIEMTDGTLLDLTTTFDTATHLTAVVSGGTLAVGRYPLRVTNPDGRYDVYYFYSATETASGHLTEPFDLVDEVILRTPRERLDATWGYDPFGNTYLYAVGGIDDAGDVRDDTEIAAVSVFGEISPFRQSEQYLDSSSPRVVNTMSTPRQGQVVVRSGQWLYAMGGASAVTNTDTSVSALATVERARILGYDTMPEAHRPDALGGSGLPFGTWYYRVSAIGPWGESLGSREVQARNVSGGVEVCWSSRSAAAVSFNVYRNTAADGRSGTTRLLLTEVAGPCILDTGRDEMQPAPGRLRSSLEAGGSLGLGVWTYRVTAEVGGVETLAGYREHVEVSDAATATVVLRWDPIPGATYNIYRSEAAADEAFGDEQTYLLAAGLELNEYSDDGSVAVDTDVVAPDGVAPLPPGSLGVWHELTSSPMAEAREGADGVVIEVPSMDAVTPDRTFIYVAGGRPDNSGSGYSDTLERVELFADGTVGTWSVETERMTTPRAFFVLLSSLGRDETPTAPEPEDPGCPDFDGDGHTADRCGGDDCDDSDPDIYPGAPEICGDGIDQDCDGSDLDCDCTTPDADGDGYDRVDCGGSDCDDDDDTIYPGADETCDDGIDQDCDGFDTSCDCATPDADGDGYDRPECGGDDCDDDDATIYPGAPEIFCDGVDQDCSGMDDCILNSVIAEPIYLFAAQGDDSFASHGAGNVGLDTIEVCEVFPPTGEIGAWTLQTNGSAHEHHGHGGVLYYDYLFTFPGVLREELGAEPSPDPSATARFPFDIEASDPALLLDRYEAAGATLEVQRSYYGTVRVNAHIYILGGNDGSGPIDSIEQHYE